MARFRRVWVPVKWKRGWQRVKGVPPAKVNDWLTGNVVPVKRVPREVRDHYRDTLYRAAEAARAYGRKVHVNSSYRDPHEQQALYEQNMNPVTGLPRPGRPFTARPGSSPHERGIGLDIPNARITPGLIEALRKRELIDDVPSEVWHVTNHAALRRGA